MLAKVSMNLAMVLMFALAGIMLVPAALGFHRYVILTGSMTGTYDPGSIVFDRAVPTNTLKVGDPITYAPPPGASPNHKLVTHRIYKLSTTKDGLRVFVTKGDANPVEDNWKFTLPKPTQDKVVFHVPYVGYAFMLLSVPKFRTLIIGVPAILAALWIVAGMWREGGEVKRRRENGGVLPWGEHIGRELPQLQPLVVGDPAAGRGIVRVPVTWPLGAADAGRNRRPVAVTAPPPREVDAPRFTRHVSEPIAAAQGRVPLPSGCVATARRHRDARTRSLPADWRLVIRAHID